MPKVQINKFRNVLYDNQTMMTQLYQNRTNLCLSLWHFASALQRFGSGQRSRGDWPFLFFRFKSAPFAARKHAIDALDFLSVACDPRPINSWNEHNTETLHAGNKKSK